MDERTFDQWWSEEFPAAFVTMPGYKAMVRPVYEGKDSKDMGRDGLREIARGGNQTSGISPKAAQHALDALTRAGKIPA